MSVLPQEAPVGLTVPEPIQRVGTEIVFEPTLETAEVRPIRLALVDLLLRTEDLVAARTPEAIEDARALFYENFGEVEEDLSVDAEIGALIDEARQAGNRDDIKEFRSVASGTNKWVRLLLFGSYKEGSIEASWEARRAVTGDGGEYHDNKTLPPPSYKS